MAVHVTEHRNYYIKLTDPLRDYVKQFKRSTVRGSPAHGGTAVLIHRRIIHQPITLNTTIQTSTISWMVKTCSQLKKPRCLIIAIINKQTGTTSEGYSANYDTCSLTNVKAYMNSVEYPYENFNESFDKNLFTMFYQNYVDFQKYYYERSNAQPYLIREKYKELGPFICIDCSRQNDDVKTSTVDLRIEFEAENNFPADVAAYCLIIHDRIIQYNPFTGEVRKM